MKQIFIILLFGCGFLGCSSFKEAPESDVTYLIDFREYTAQGFLITPEKYLGEYESVGIILMDFYPEIIKTMPPGKTFSNRDYNVVFYGLEKYYIKKTSMQNSIDKIFLRCKEIGADALVNLLFKIDYYMNGPVKIPYLVISGLAIKRG